MICKQAQTENFKCCGKSYELIGILPDQKIALLADNSCRWFVTNQLALWKLNTNHGS